jgi:outer membrane protein assembly factor BamE
MMCNKKSGKSRISVLSILAISLITSSLSACSNSWYPFVYHPPVSQGNVINDNAASQLKPGMSKAEVVNLMGNPVLDTPLSPDTWHYVYTIHEGSKVIQHKQVTLYFSGDRLVRIN